MPRLWWPVRRADAVGALGRVAVRARRRAPAAEVAASHALPSWSAHRVLGRNPSVGHAARCRCRFRRRRRYRPPTGTPCPTKPARRSGTCSTSRCSSRPDRSHRPMRDTRCCSRTSRPPGTQCCCRCSSRSHRTCQSMRGRPPCWRRTYRPGTPRSIRCSTRHRIAHAGDRAAHRTGRQERVGGARVAAAGAGLGAVAYIGRGPARVPLGWNASAGHAVEVPVQVSATSQPPDTAARHTVLLDAYTSAGHVAEPRPCRRSRFGPRRGRRRRRRRRRRWRWRCRWFPVRTRSRSCCPRTDRRSRRSAHRCPRCRRQPAYCRSRARLRPRFRSPTCAARPTRRRARASRRRCRTMRAPATRARSRRRCHRRRWRRTRRRGRAAAAAAESIAALLPVPIVIVPDALIWNAPPPAPGAPLPPALLAPMPPEQPPRSGCKSVSVLAPPAAPAALRAELAAGAADRAEAAAAAARGRRARSVAAGLSRALARELPPGRRRSRCTGIDLRPGVDVTLPFTERDGLVAGQLDHVVVRDVDAAEANDHHVRGRPRVELRHAVRARAERHRFRRTCLAADCRTLRSLRSNRSRSRRRRAPLPLCATAVVPSWARVTVEVVARGTT